MHILLSLILMFTLNAQPDRTRKGHHLPPHCQGAIDTCRIGGTL